MTYSKRSKSLYLDKEAITALSMLQEGLLKPVTSLMTQKEMLEVDESSLYKGKTVPFSFILSPSGTRNEETLRNTKAGEILTLVDANRVIGEIEVKEVFEVDPTERIKNIYGAFDLDNKEFKNRLKRLGRYAVSGEYSIECQSVKMLKESIKAQRKALQAKHSTAMIMSANPFHRAHERVIRITLEKTDMLTIFLLKPFNESNLSYAIREKSLRYFIDRYLPTSKVQLLPLEITYLFVGFNEVISDAIMSQNFGFNKIVIGKNHTGVGIYYDKNTMKSIFDSLKGISIDIEFISEFVYCNVCTTLVSTETCPHGAHHHIKYHSDSILELLSKGVLPPAVLMRKDISAIILSELFQNRFDNLETIFQKLLPSDGILEEPNEKDFYLELMKLYQTTSLT